MGRTRCPSWCEAPDGGFDPGGGPDPVGGEGRRSDSCGDDGGIPNSTEVGMTNYIRKT